MKRFHLIFPKKNAIKWVEYAHTNGISNALTWYEENDMFSFSGTPSGINVVAVATDEQTAALMQSEWKAFLIS